MFLFSGFFSLLIYRIPEAEKIRVVLDNLNTHSPAAFYEAFHLSKRVTCVWAGGDSAWEQEKLEARKLLENAAESHTSGARFVGRHFDTVSY